MASRKSCAACGASALSRVRAVVVKSSQPPRMGLVCKACARCGVIVVPAALVMLPARPRKVARGDFTRSVLERGEELQRELDNEADLGESEY